MEVPEVHYARSGDEHIAYQVFGEGGFDLVFVAEFWNSIEAMWEESRYRRFLERLGSFARVICLDQRGTGLSDPVSLSELPTLEQWADDVVAVHIGSRIASLAEPSEMLVSSTVRDLVAGSGLVFVDRGSRDLKGVPEPWHVYAVEDA